MVASLCNRGTRQHDIAASLRIIAERSASGIVTGRAEASYLVKQKNGRRDRYQIQAHPPRVAQGGLSPAPARAREQDPSVRKLQLAILENLTIFSRNMLLVFGCECKLRADTGDQAAQAVS